MYQYILIFKLLIRYNFWGCQFFFYIRNRKIKQTNHSICCNVNVFLLQVFSQAPPICCPRQLCRNCCSKLRVKAAFSRQFCLTTASQFQLSRWSLGNRCICLCLRLKPLCPYYMRYHDPFIIGYKKASVLQWYIEGKSLEDLKYLRKGTNSFSDISLIWWTVFAFFCYWFSSLCKQTLHQDLNPVPRQLPTLCFSMV